MASSCLMMIKIDYDTGQIVKDTFMMQSEKFLQLYKEFETHTPTRTRAVSATPTRSDSASDNRSKRTKRGSLLQADLGSRSNAV